MKKFALSAGVALAMTLSAVAQAHPTNQGYVEDSSATIWRNSFGECLHCFKPRIRLTNDI